MTSRHNSSSHIPYLPISLEMPELQFRSGPTALFDTGFNQDVVVPAAALPGDVPPLFCADVRLADSSLVTLPAYFGSIELAGTTIGPVLVLAMGNEAIVGLSVITQFRFTIDHDRSIGIEPSALRVRPRQFASG